MPTFDNLTTGIETRLTAGMAALKALPADLKFPWRGNPSLTDIAVLVQDAVDIENKIDEAVQKIGMLCFINMPGFRNHDPLGDQVNAVIKLIVEVGEEPIVWRDNPLTKPKAKDAAQIVAALLQGYVINGFEPLRVMTGDFQKDKKRQIYFVTVETLNIFDAISV